MNVLFLDQYGSLGGGQQVLLELVRAAMACGHHASVLIPQGVCAQKILEQKASVFTIPECALSQGKKNWRDCLRLFCYSVSVLCVHFRALRQADLVYVNGNRLLPVAFMASLVLGKNTVYHIHLNHEGFERRLFLLALQSRRTRALVLPSSFIQEELLTYSSRFADPRVRVLENGLDSRFSDTPFIDRFSGKKLQHICIVGRISSEKGQDVLRTLAPQFPDLYFHVLGDAAFSEGDFVQNLQNNAPANVIFHGWVENIPQKINEIGVQVCIVPSRGNFEAFGLVCIEMTALCCLVVVRHKGALAQAAQKLSLESFEDDSSLAKSMYDIQNMTSDALCKKVKLSYKECIRMYSNTMFKERICDFFKMLAS